MVVPFKGATTGSKDDFNFYHSQLRTNIECAFGQLVHKWTILWSPLLATMGAAKQIAFVMCLCRLHNFCKDNCSHQNYYMDGNNPVLNDAERLLVNELLEACHHADNVLEELEIP